VTSQVNLLEMMDHAHGSVGIFPTAKRLAVPEAWVYPNRSGSIQNRASFFAEAATAFHSRSMPNTILIGAQWGDEGKGKIIDVLTEQADVVVRSQGGNNAGHTVIVDGTQYTLHLLPSGLLHPGKVCVIGNGVVLDPMAVVKEIEGVEAKGIKVAGRLFISDQAHLVLPYHRVLDAHREDTSSVKIGTTRRGIGPAYADKINRVGIRVCDLMVRERFEGKLKTRLDDYNRQAAAFDWEQVEYNALVQEALVAAEKLRPYVTNTVVYLEEARQAGKRILFEGAQGTYLDIDHGTYPYVTSSNTTAGGAATGSGIAPHRMDRVIGVIKAYTTRVGEGPFPSESDPLGDRFHGMGREFGATTGRARRCGWFDAVMARHAAIVNGLDELAVTNVDGLDGLNEVSICVAYELDGQRISYPPAAIEDWARCEPVWETLPGWPVGSTDSAREWAQLPDAARTYLERLASLTGVPITIVSVGPGREATLHLA